MSQHHRSSGPGAVGRRILAVLLLLTVAEGARGEAPLLTADIVRFLKAGISEHTILAELRERGFGELLDWPREAAVREAGASETLVVALRRAAPTDNAPTPAPSSTTPTPSREAPPPGPPAARSSPQPTFAAAARTVRVPVSVLDKNGEPLMGLRSADFRVSEEGRRQDITLFSGERRPLRIALALDTSGSMESKMGQVEAALKHFIDLLEPTDEILVITFNSEVHVVQDFTSDRDLLGSVLDRMEAGGGTALYDAAFTAIQRVAKSPAESKAVVLVTDGVDTASSTSFEALLELARRSEVPVFSIGLDSGSQLRDLSRMPSRPGGGGPGRGWPGGGGGSWPGGSGRSGGRGRARKPREGFDAKPLVALADETGGRAEILKGAEHYTPDSDTPGAGRLKGAVEAIAITLRHRYLLGYEPPEGKSGWRTIRVEVDRQAATARARKGYYAGG
ncbi:MAG TPA: VWA domain-containing protein [Vicinamibacteria bacterium]|jgi:VWFA-related protein|nr:VWA domain-containing protein [Vicinamibacteria bacterium]